MNLLQRLREHIEILLICTLLCLVQKPCFGQRDSIVINPTYYDYTTGYHYDSVALVPGVIYTIYNPPHYSNSSNLPLKLYSPEGLPITFRHRDGVPWTLNGFSFEVMVYEGTQTPSAYFGAARTNQTWGLDQVYYTTQAGKSMFLHTNGRSNSDAPLDTHFEVYVCPSDESEINNIRINDPSDGNITLRWNDNSDATSWTIQYGKNYFANDSSITTNSTYAQLNGLELGTTYYFRIFNNTSLDNTYCTAPIHTYKTQCDALHRTCIDYTDLLGCATRGYYGSFDSPHANKGIVDYGPESSISRHTVHTANTLDSRTAYHLHTLPPSGAPSVRIGNWLNGAQAESIVYGIHVDTNNHGLLLVRYAIVFEDPNHGMLEQPHVSIQIVDEKLNVIDPNCGAVDFYANEGLGWNSLYDGVLLWKDWSAIGLDLTAYHDQDIYVRIENYDCAVGGHFGYCYISIECLDKIVKSNRCGAVGLSELTAPAGFTYRWYAANAPNTTLGNGRVFTTSIPGTYYCQLGMLDGNCHFTLKASVGDRYPWADFSHEEIIDTERCEVLVKFHDLSTVSALENQLQDLHERVDSVSWDFGDGTQSSERNPRHHYDHGGSYEVHLYAYLGNGACENVKVRTIDVSDNPCTFDTMKVWICHNADCYVLNQHRFCDTGSYDLINGVHHTHLILLRDTVETDYYFTFDINSHHLPFQYNGEAFYASVEDYQIRYTNQQGCDSIIHVALHIHNDTTIRIDTTICREDFPISWNGFTFSNPQAITIPGTGVYMQDSTTIYEMHQSEITAIIIASPEMATFSHPDIMLSDAGNGVRRIWLLPDYTTTEQHFSYAYPLDHDSITIRLISYSNLGCPDTDSRSISLIREAIWVPNVFTPDLETNKLFRIYGEGFDKIKVYIYTREGLLVSQFTGPEGYWDGTATGRNTNAHGGTPCPQGTYTYRVVYTYISTPNNIQSKTGTITLLR